MFPRVCVCDSNLILLTMTNGCLRPPTRPFDWTRERAKRSGDVQFKPSLRAEVLVVDQAGKPVEGFAIRRKYDSTNSWCVAHNTDETGTAFFHVHPNSQGQFRVTDLKGPVDVSQAMNLSVKFQTGETDPKEPFRIKVTDEQIALLRKGK